MSSTRANHWRIPIVFVLSMVGAYTCAFTYVVVLYWSLPRTEKAYGQGLYLTLDDPFVRHTAVWFANVAGLAVFIPALYAVRDRNLIVCFAVALACALAEIAVVTPFQGPFAILGALLALAGAFIWCRRSKARIIQIRSA
jgi:hypothetical protein